MSVSKSLTGDFAGNLNTTQLTNEINNDNGITPICLGVFNKNDLVTIKFDAGLSAGELTILDGIISSHSAVYLGDVSGMMMSKQTTTDLNYDTVFTQTTKYLNAGQYVVHWYYEFTSSDGNPDIRIIIDDANVIHTNINRTAVVSSTISYDKTGFNPNVILTEGVHTIKIQFRVQSEAEALDLIHACTYIAEINY